MTNKDYASYDTLQVVENLSKATDEGDMIPLNEQRERIGSKVVIMEKDEKKRKRKK